MNIQQFVFFIFYLNFIWSKTGIPVGTVVDGVRNGKKLTVIGKDVGEKMIENA